VRALILFTILLWPACLLANYSPSEILVIPWGDGPNELGIREPYMEMLSPDDSDSLYEVWFPSGGPHLGFVDINDNIYFASYSISYLEGFHNDGESFVEFLHSSPGFNPDLFQGGVSEFYVDSDGLIYISSMLAYIAIADTLGNLLNRLIPPGYESNEPVSLLFYNFDDELTISAWDQNYKYKDGEFSENGYSAWKASDGYYYRAKKYDESSFIFMKFQTYDHIDTFYVSFDGHLHLGSLLGIDLNDQFFLRFTEEEVDIPLGVLILDNEFNEIDRFELLPRPENQYLWYVHNSPFLRGDGNVYQFLCEDDGMHIIRWSKE